MTIEDNPFQISGPERLVEDQSADYIGKDALMKIKAEGVSRKLVGIELGGEAQVEESPDASPAYQRQGGRPGHLDRLLTVKRLSILTPDRRAKLTPLSGTAEVVPVVNRGDPRGFV